MLNSIIEEILLLAIHISNQPFMLCSSAWHIGMKSSLDKEGKSIAYIFAVGAYAFLSSVYYQALSDTECDFWLHLGMSVCAFT